MQTTASHTTQHFLSGGGEMGKLTRSLDWSKTPVGAIAEWPQSLRTTLSIILNSKFPMFLFWGPEQVCFYNDAYRPSLGNEGKHPSILGMPGEAAWPEIWVIIKPLIDQVLAGGEATWSEDQLIPIYRNGKLEDVYWTFSYSPVNDESGKPAGVFVTCSETTDKVLGLKRIEESERRFRDMVTQVPVGITIFRGSDFVVEMANDTYLKLVDRKRERFVGRPLFDSLPEVKEAIMPLLTAVFNTGVPYYGTEFPVYLNRNNKTDVSYFNFLYQPLREPDGSITGIVVVANEVTLQVLGRHYIAQSEKQFRNVVMQSPFAIAIFRGSNWIIEMANQILLRNIWRKTEAEVIGKKLLDVFPELESQQFSTLLQQVTTTGKAYRENEAVAFIETDDGAKKFYLDFEYAPLFDTENEVSGVMVTVNDVTERIEAKEFLKEASERLTLAVEGGRLGTWDLNLETRDVIHSPRMAEIFGHDASAMLTHVEMRAQLHPEDIHRIVETAFEKALSTGIYLYEARVVHPDKSVHWIKTSGKVVFDNNRKPIRMLGTTSDVTEQKRAEHIIEESEKKFRLLANSMPQMVWTGDPFGNLNYFNQSVFDYTGLTARQVDENGWLQIIHPADRDENMRKWKASIQTGCEFLFEHRFRRYDGEYRWQLSRAVAQRDKNGDIQMWVGTSTDIHDRKLFTDELEKQVQQRTRELKQINEALIKSNLELEQFAYVASHDLQEPLRKIQAFASRILDTEQINLSNKGRDYFSRMQSASKRMQQLILDLLSYSAANTAEKHFETTDLNILLNAVKEHLKESIEQKQATITATSLPVCNVIVFQFEQLFTNLISNALKFSIAGVAPRIHITTGIINGAATGIAGINTLKDYYAITFSDNGIGFEPEFSERIFQVFQRLHGKDAYEGTGIGLAICKRIVENHHGFISASGMLNKGAEFIVYLPTDYVSKQ
jgi:PAS domain S-box-containing protein